MITPVHSMSIDVCLMPNTYLWRMRTQPSMRSRICRGPGKHAR